MFFKERNLLVLFRCTCKCFRLLPVNAYVIDDRIEIFISSRHRAEADYLDARKLSAHCLESYRGLIEIYKATNNRTGLAKQVRLLKAMEGDF